MASRRPSHSPRARKFRSRTHRLRALRRPVIFAVGFVAVLFVVLRRAHLL